MKRGSMIIALFLLTAAHPSPSQDEAAERTRAEHTQRAAETIAAAVRDTIRTEKEDLGCDIKREDRRSDLCAQWKAADAADLGAFWSRTSGFFAFAAVAISALSLALTWLSSKRQLRAYLSISDVTLKKDHPQIDFVIKNNGQTPACEVEAFVEIKVDGIVCTSDPHVAHADGIIDPGIESVNCPGFSIDIAHFIDGKLIPRVEVEIKLFYKDVISISRWMRHYRRAVFMIEPKGQHVLKDRAGDVEMHGAGSLYREKLVWPWTYRAGRPVNYARRSE